MPSAVHTIITGSLRPELSCPELILESTPLVSDELLVLFFVVPPLPAVVLVTLPVELFTFVDPFGITAVPGPG